jgi:two-component system chemotaxis response regulator CheB
VEAPGERKIRILVVDDSAYHRRTLVKIISSDSRMEVVGTAMDGEDAIKKFVNLKPDLITLDLEMPRMDGFTFLRWLMKSFPRPVLVISSRESEKNVFRALELGAVDFVVKPVKYASIQLANIGAEVLSKIKQIAYLRVETLQARMEAVSVKPPPLPEPSVAPGTYQLVAIGASTGGPPALQSILTRLPRGLPVGVVISQHMPQGFTKLFAERLDRLSGFKVREARGGEEVTSGMALIAPGGKHLVLHRNDRDQVSVLLESAREWDRYVPSIDRMMSSAAEIYRKQLIGVILTGMGDDGVLGMQAVKKHHGLTIAESEETCVVYGMPREVFRIGVADRVLPLSGIGELIVRECQSRVA